MIRYVVTAAGALALLSGVALAETTVYDNGAAKVITRTAPEGMASKRVVTKHRIDRYGNLVTKKKIIREGLSGSSVTRVRKTTEPMSGSSTVTRSTEIR